MSVENNQPNQGSNQSVPPPIDSSTSINKFQSLLDTAKVFTQRFLKSDFQTQQITDAEKLALHEANFPEKDRLASNFLAWRRALLWISGISLAIAAIFSVFELYDVIDQRMPGIFSFILIMFILAKLAASFLVIRAALAWTNVAVTKKLTRLGWMSMFLVPFAIAMIPMEPFIDKRGLGIGGAQMTIFAMGAFFLITLLPMVLGLFPGLIRSSLTIKTLLPESTMPGWIALIIAPLYALFFLIALMIAMQAQSFLLIISLVALCYAPLILVVHAKNLTSPVSSEELDDTLRVARKKMQFYNLVGIIALVAWLLVKMKTFEFTPVASFVSNLLATVLLVTVATSDLLLSLFYAAFKRESELRGSDRLQNLEKRLERLDQLGLTSLFTGILKSDENIRGDDDVSSS